MAEVLIRWEGVTEASNVMRSIGNNATRHLNPTLRKILKPYRTPIRMEAPLGPTGNLRRGIAPRVSAKGVSWVSKAPHSWLVAGAIGRAGAGDPYGPPNPFLHRGIGRHREQIRSGLQQVIEEWIAKAEAVSRVVG